MNNLLECTQLEKSFSGVPVLRGVSFTLAAGSVLGLVGENGAGKSTLMNLLGGVLQADGGEMRFADARYAPKNPAEAVQTGVAFVHQELNLFSNLSIAENLFVPHFPKNAFGLIDRQAIRQGAVELLQAVELDASPETLVESLAPGERQMVEIAKALGQNARLMIFDEPTTSLTARETEGLFALIQRMRMQGMGVIYVSHILNDVLRLCDEIVVLRDGSVMGAGRRDEFDVRRLIRLMVGQELTQLFPTRSQASLKETVLEVEALTQPGIIENISFTLQRGEVLGLAGLMGAGRTEMARILFGLDACDRGNIKLNGQDIQKLSPRERIQRGLALLTEDRRAEGLMMDASIDDNAALVVLPQFTAKGWGLIERARLATAVGAMTELVQVKGAARAEQAVRTLSGGNQQKVVLAKWLLQKPVVFILDEPTRGVDVAARAEIYRIINELAEGGSGVLLISSELEELIGMCDRILVLQRGSLVARFTRAEFNREQILRAAFPSTHIE